MSRIAAAAESWAALYGLRILGTLAILLLGRWASSVLRRLFRRVTSRRHVDPTLATYGGNIIYVATMVFAIVAALAQLGVETTSIIAVLGTASLAVGLALQGSLSNFAAGLLILVLRPFKVGDTISAAGVSGVVEELQFLTTQLRLPDNRVLLIPHSKLTGDSIVNFSLKESLRAEFQVAVGPQHEVARVRSLLLDAVREDPRVLPEPAPDVSLWRALPSSLTFVVQPWVRAADHGRYTAEALEDLKRKLEEKGVAIFSARR